MYFSRIEKAFQTVFWALFGVGEGQEVELQGYSSGFTERVGYIVYGAYNFATVIVLLNMLIAMMSRTFGKIKVNNRSQY